MGIPCFIAKEIGDNQYRAIWCAFDGYLEHAGVILARHYNTEEMVDKLLDLGNLSGVHPTLEPDPSKPHMLGNHQKNVTIAYGRDYGEKGQEASIKTLDELNDDSDWTETTYIFTKDKEWKYFHIGHLVEGLHELAHIAEKIEAQQEEQATEDSEEYEDTELDEDMSITPKM